MKKGCLSIFLFLLVVGLIIEYFKYIAPILAVLAVVFVIYLFKSTSEEEKNIQESKKSKDKNRKRDEAELNNINNEAFHTQFRESYKLLKTTKNPETFFERLQFARERADKNELKFLESHIEKVSKDFLYRFDDNVRTKVLSLKTNKARNENLVKYGESIIKYTSLLSKDNQLLLKDILGNWKDLVDNSNNKEEYIKNEVTISNLPENSYSYPEMDDFPEDVFDLLWFSDGPFKNIEKEYEAGKDFFSFTFSSDNEPSAIDPSLPVEQKYTDEKVGYYPSYEKLNPRQRYVYLNWLRNIDESIDISYVFIFYYGLERHLFTKKIDQSVEMIFRLKDFHDSNNSFNSYSNDAILIASMIRKKPEWISRLNPDKLNPPIYATIKGYVTGCFSAYDIIYFAKNVGWTNNRYIKNETPKFEYNVIQTLNKLYQSNEYYIPVEKYNTIHKSIPIFLANYSLDSNNRFSQLPDILSDNEIKTSLYEVLHSAHEMTKLQLREERKNK